MSFLKERTPADRLLSLIWTLDMGVSMGEELHETEMYLHEAGLVAMELTAKKLFSECAILPDPDVMPIVPLLLKLVYGEIHARKTYLRNTPRAFVSYISSIVTEAAGDADFGKPINRFDVLKSFLALLREGGYREDLSRLVRYVDELERKSLKRVKLSASPDVSIC